MIKLFQSIAIRCGVESKVFLHNRSDLSRPTWAIILSSIPGLAIAAAFIWPWQLLLPLEPTTFSIIAVIVLIVAHIAAVLGGIAWGHNIIQRTFVWDEITLKYRQALQERRKVNKANREVMLRQSWRSPIRRGRVTAESIEAENNIEVRRAMVEAYDEEKGVGSFILDSGCEPVHTDDFGVLYKKTMHFGSAGVINLAYVKVLNSTPDANGEHKEYFLKTDPNFHRAKQAVAASFGMDENEYNPLEES